LNNEVFLIDVNIIDKPSTPRLPKNQSPTRRFLLLYFLNIYA
jgi:hypothetical protein